MKQPHTYTFYICVLGSIAFGVSGCRQYTKYAIEIRDASTHASLENVRITTRYNLTEEFRFPWNRPKKFTTATDNAGCAIVKAEPGLGWWLQIETEGRPMHSVWFDSNGNLDQSLRKLETNEGWIRTSPCVGHEDGTVDAMIHRIET